MAELPIATQCGTGAPAAPPVDSGPVSGYGACFHRRNDEFGGGNHSSRIGVRDMLSSQ